MSNTIILVGPRASGKTTVGKMLAASLQLQFIDTDERVQEKTHKTIAQIVDEHGWDYFRSIESQILKEVSRPHRVIATGGGMIMSPENRDYMKIIGSVFYLLTSAQTVITRLRSNPAVHQRPSLTGLSIEDEITDIITSRDPLYQETAHFVIDANNSKQRVAQDIIDIYSRLRPADAGEIHSLSPERK